MTNRKKTSDVDQAIILCGGLGTRLRPLTNSTPKPMVKVNDEPFIYYLLSQLSIQGIKKFTLLTGYLGKNISEYFGDGSRWGWKIEYSEGPVEWDTGRRIWEAQNKLDDKFLLLYSDNFATFNLKKIVEFHNKNERSLTLSLAEKKDGNIEIDSEGNVLNYDKHRTKPNLNHVEIGYMVIDKASIFSLYDELDINFSEIITKAIKKLSVGGFLVKDGYKSISDPSRLEITQQFLKFKKIILIDRDGVINKRASKGEYVTNWADFHFIKETYEAMCSLSEKGYQFIVISNQAGIARGMIEQDNLNDITKKMIAEFNKDSVKILGFYYCPHHWDDGCDCRKPNTKLFEKASADFSFRLDQSVFIGDDSRDCEAAYNANCKSIFIGEELDLDGLREVQLPIGVYSNLLEALPDIESHYDGQK